MAEVEPVVCTTYTAARRYPLVLGKIHGWTMPVQLSRAQLAVLLGGWALLFLTKDLWGWFGGFINTAILLGLPAAGAWWIRSARIDGRDAHRWLFWTLIGLTRRRGEINLGRPVRSNRAYRCRDRSWIAQLPSATRGDL